MLNKKIRITVIILVVLIVLAAIALQLLVYEYKLHCMSATLMHIDYDIIQPFIRARGYFPKSESDLETAGFLLRNLNGKNAQYFKRSDFTKGPDIKDPNDWHSFDTAAFKMFAINYGIDANTLVIKNKKLCDKASGKQVFLINGPYESVFYKSYESISFEWFRILSKE
jgi:hypothetical protein